MEYYEPVLIDSLHQVRNLKAEKDERSKERKREREGDEEKGEEEREGEE